MLQKKRRRSWPLQAKQRRRDDRTVTLSQIVHLSLRCMFEPDASFDRQRRPYARSSNPCASAMTRTAPCFASPDGTVRHLAARCVTERSEAMKDNDRTSEREYQDRLESLLKNAFNTQLRPLKSLETATKKWCAQPRLLNLRYQPFCGPR
jgi:hypothetical protein